MIEWEKLWERVKGYPLCKHTTIHHRLVIGLALFPLGDLLTGFHFLRIASLNFVLYLSIPVDERKTQSSLCGGNCTNHGKSSCWTFFDFQERPLCDFSSQIICFQKPNHHRSWFELFLLTRSRTTEKAHEAREEVIVQNNPGRRIPVSYRCFVSRKAESSSETDDDTYPRKYCRVHSKSDTKEMDQQPPPGSRYPFKLCVTCHIFRSLKRFPCFSSITISKLIIVLSLWPGAC